MEKTKRSAFKFFFMKTNFSLHVIFNKNDLTISVYFYMIIV